MIYLAQNTINMLFQPSRQTIHISNYRQYIYYSTVFRLFANNNQKI